VEAKTEGRPTPAFFPALRVAGIVAGSVPATRASGAWDNAQALAGMSGYGLAAFFKEA